MKTTSGIYCITNLINNKKYIGQSIYIENRWHYHKSSCHWQDNKPLYRAFQKYGLENFKFEIIEELPPDRAILNEREKYWIQYYQSTVHQQGYNLTKGGDEYSISRKMSDEEIMDIRIAKINYRSKEPIFEQYKHKISWATFCKIWEGTLYPDIMKEIYEDKALLQQIEHVLKQKMNLRKSSLTVDTIVEIRQKRQNGQTRSATMKEYPDIKPSTFDSIWYNKHYQEVQPGNEAYISILRQKD